MSDNLRIWDALGKTDPAHTKQFVRGGGFKGTAIKPMYANKRMTEQFGPVGDGWGMGEPKFEMVPAGDEILVFCTVAVWYKEVGEDRYNKEVYGVGGDKVVSQIFAKDSHGQRVRKEDGQYLTYPQTDDEAFKKAYTDALSNAMKFIGVGADVHMGLFDDSIYVREVGAEFEEQRKAVEAEVEKQKAGAEPPEPEFLYAANSGVLICRVLNSEQKQGKKDGKWFAALKINGHLTDDSKSNMLFSWHTSTHAALAGSKGKLIKAIVSIEGKFANIEELLEIDGVRFEKPAESFETRARLAASNIGWSEKRLMVMYNLEENQHSWEKVYAEIQKETESLKNQEVPY